MATLNYFNNSASSSSNGASSSSSQEEQLLAFKKHQMMEMKAAKRKAIITAIEEAIAIRGNVVLGFSYGACNKIVNGQPSYQKLMTQGGAITATREGGIFGKIASKAISVWSPMIVTNADGTKGADIANGSWALPTPRMIGPDLEDMPVPGKPAAGIHKMLVGYLKEAIMEQANSIQALMEEALEDEDRKTALELQTTMQELVAQANKVSLENVWANEFKFELAGIPLATGGVFSPTLLDQLREQANLDMDILGMTPEQKKKAKQTRMMVCEVEFYTNSSSDFGFRVVRILTPDWDEVVTVPVGDRGTAISGIKLLSIMLEEEPKPETLPLATRVASALETANQTLAQASKTKRDGQKEIKALAKEYGITPWYGLSDAIKAYGKATDGKDGRMGLIWALDAVKAAITKQGGKTVIPALMAGDYTFSNVSTGALNNKAADGEAEGAEGAEGAEEEKTLVPTVAFDPLLEIDGFDEM